MIVASATLSNGELDLARYLADKRFNSQFKSKHYTGSQDGLEIEFMAICGEMGFAKMFNLYYDPFRISACDFTFNGLTVDVKTMRDPQHNLLINEAAFKKGKAIVYALMYFQLPQAMYLGYAHRGAIAAGCRPKQGKDGVPYLVVPRQMLKRTMLLVERTYHEPDPS